MIEKTKKEQTEQTEQFCNGCGKNKTLESFYIDSRTHKHKKTCISCTTIRRNKVKESKKGKVGFYRLVENHITCYPY